MNPAPPVIITLAMALYLIGSLGPHERGPHPEDGGGKWGRCRLIGLDARDIARTIPAVVKSNKAATSPLTPRRPGSVRSSDRRSRAPPCRRARRGCDRRRRRAA